MAKSRGKKPKKPELGAHPQSEKTPRALAVTAGGERPSWVFNIMDLDHPRWGWALADRECLTTLQRRLSSFESRTWFEIEKPRDSHSISVDDVIRDAQNRLIEIRQDDAPDLYSLRIGSTERLWGIRDGAKLKILWWDPFHEICPSAKKYT